MIIWINATVCGDVDHGDDGQHKIAGSDQRRKRGQAWERACDRAKEEIKGPRQECRFFTLRPLGSSCGSAAPCE